MTMKYMLIHSARSCDTRGTVQDASEHGTPMALMVLQRRYVGK